MSKDIILRQPLPQCVTHQKQNTRFFISSIRLKLTKNQAKAKQHPDAELQLFEHYSLSSSMLLSKNNMRYSKSVAKQMCLFEWDYMINHNENKAENQK